MTESFLIEFRLQGFAKRYAKWVNSRISREAKRLKLGRLKERRFVSHITLFGSARTDHLQGVITEVEMTCRKYSLVRFKLGGFDGFKMREANWLYLDVEPSSDMKQLVNELSQNLLRSEKIIYDTCAPQDLGFKKFHSSLGKFDPIDKKIFDRLIEFAETKCNLESYKRYKASLFRRIFKGIKQYLFRIKEDETSNMSLCLLRVTILGRGSRIKAEYDLVLKKLLSRRESLSRHIYHQSIQRLQKLLNVE